jgi:hypothetical protein
MTCDLSEQPRAYHDGSYAEIVERQKPLFDRFCEAVFSDKVDAEGRPAPFTYINETTAYKGYIALCRTLNGGRNMMRDHTFRAELSDWLSGNAPHLQRTQAWQNHGSSHVRLWYNSRLSDLRLAVANDSKYVEGDPGREWWVGPEV